MKTLRFRVVLAMALLAAVLLIPTTATANGWFAERWLTQLVPAPAGIPVYNPGSITPFSVIGVSGDNVVYLKRTTVPLSKWEVDVINTRTRAVTVVSDDPSVDMGQPVISGDWVVWVRDGNDIDAKNLATGVVKHVTTDGAVPQQWLPSVSGNLLVYSQFTGVNWDVYGYDLSRDDPPFAIATGAPLQVGARIYGDRVVYMEQVAGKYNIFMKTFGSSDPPVKLGADGVDQKWPDIGERYVAWLVPNSSGKDMVKYYDLWTGVTHNGPTNTLHDMENPRVAGSQIIYNTDVFGSQDMYAWDASLDEWVTLTADAGVQNQQAVDGDQVVYLSNGLPMLGKMIKPQIALSDAPASMSYNAVLKIKGTIEDFGRAIGNAPLVLQSWDPSAARWVPGTAFSADEHGAFEIATPANPTRTSYRIAYAGEYPSPPWPDLGVGIGYHFSTASDATQANPQVSLSKPSAPSSPKHNVAFTSKGTLKPRHTGGSSPVQIQCEKKVAGVWVLKATYPATVIDYSTYSQYKASVKLTSKGSWRIRAYYPDSKTNASTVSGWVNRTAR